MSILVYTYPPEQVQAVCAMREKYALEEEEKRHSDVNSLEFKVGAEQVKTEILLSNFLALTKIMASADEHFKQALHGTSSFEDLQKVLKNENEVIEEIGNHWTALEGFETGGIIVSPYDYPGILTQVKKEEAQPPKVESTFFQNLLNLFK